MALPGSIAITGSDVCSRCLLATPHEPEAICSSICQEVARMRRQKCRFRQFCEAIFYRFVLNARNSAWSVFRKPGRLRFRFLAASRQVHATPIHDTGT